MRKTKTAVSADYGVIDSFALAGFMLWASIMLGGCAMQNERAEIAPPPPALILSKNTYSKNIYNADVASIQPAAGDLAAMAAPLPATVHEATEHRASCAALRSDLSSGEAIAYDFGDSRVGLGMGAANSGDPVDERLDAKAMVRYSVSLNSPPSARRGCEPAFWGR